MRFEVLQKGRRSVSMKERISMQSRVTVDNAVDMRLLLAEAIRSQGAQVIVDISMIAYMDTAGLATLLEALRIAHKQGKRLVLEGIQDQPLRLFEATELDHVFEIRAKGTR
jgi:anti-sigma B factor antagonist